MKRWALKTLLIASILTLGVVKTSFATVYYNNYGVSSFINGHYIAGSGSPWLSLNASTTPFQVSATTTGNIYIFYNGGTTPSSGGPLGSIASSTGIACSFYITPSFESPIATSSLCYGNNLYPNIDYYLRVATNSTFVDQYTTFAVNSFGLSISISDISNFIPYFSTHIISVIPASNTTIIPFVSTSTQRFADFDIDELDFYNNTLSATDTIAIINTQLVNNNIASYQYTKSLTESFLA